MKYTAIGAFPPIFGERRVKEEARARVVCVAGSRVTAEWVARRLRAIGYEVDDLVEVEPSESSISLLLKDLIDKYDVVVVTGGVEPGSAPTFTAAAEALGRSLVVDEEALRLVEEHYYTLYREEGGKGAFRLPEEAEPLFKLPEGSIVIPNPRGPSPGVILEEDGKYLVCLPSSPLEACEMFEDEVDQYVRSLLGVNLSATVHVMTRVWDAGLLARVVEELASKEPWIFAQVKLNVYSEEGRGVTVTVFAKEAEELSEKLETAVKLVEEELERMGINYIKRA
ncbi:MAG: hypothetical protein DRJ43_02350 [Thermoprotei archaeon]|nr:MAG: hypothetical protein DRJ43_02350 [Thermoprotei archaeon]